jgi:hypothetical protein
LSRAADTAALKRLEPFVGEWNLEASFPNAPVGRAAFEWILGGGYIQHYFDSRGVGTLTREKADFSPLPFSQRYTGTFSDDGCRRRQRPTILVRGG